MWNYRVIQDDEKETVGLYEVFYNTEGEIFAHAELPVIAGEDLDDLLSTLKMLVTDLEQHMDNNDLILSLGEIEFSEIDTEESEEIDIEDLDDFFSEDD